MADHAQALHRDDLLADPHAQFLIWFAAAGQAGVRTPEAMALATAAPDGSPSVRMVLLKSADERGYAFFTNHEGRKGTELDANPQAALLFHWDELGRQLRIEGAVERLPAEESDAYFASRPIGSQLGAIASPQSRPIPSRTWIEERIAEVQHEAGGGQPERPAHWGGYLVRPRVYQFWQHRSDRVHDAFRYSPAGAEPGDDAGAGWRIDRLGP